MTDQTMIERVARAICAAGIGGSRKRDQIDQLEIETYWRDFIPEALAALTAMREPTEVMVLSDGVSAGTVDGLDHYLDPDVARHAWQSMIDAALAEG